MASGRSSIAPRGPWTRPGASAPDKTKENPNRNYSPPVLLYGSTTIGDGLTTPPIDTSAMSTQFRKPILIDEIRFRATSHTNRIAARAANLGGAVRAKLDLGGLDLTNGFVPIWNFGTAMNMELISENVGSLDNYSYSHFRWKLPRPLYVQNGQQLVTQFYRTTETTNSPSGSQGVAVAYAGRYVAPGQEVPREIAVPYVTSFVTDIGATYAKSRELELVNPFDVDLHVQRMIGRLQYTFAGSLIEVVSFDTDLTGNGPFISILDSLGRQIAGNPMIPMDWSQAFSFNRRAWTFNHVLAPKERYNIEIMNIPTDVRAMVSIVGWRMEKLS